MSTCKQEYDVSDGCEWQVDSSGRVTESLAQQHDDRQDVADDSYKDEGGKNVDPDDVT